MTNFDQILDTLDPDQRQAATITENSVIAAGAGSGKTRVLATRYLHLVIKRGIPIDEIYALTFTQKAASEMNARIYASLSSAADPKAQEALCSFDKANIGTLDSLCNSIARQACAAYGVAPDFRIDNDEAERLADELALPYFIEHRSSPAIRQLMKRFSLAELPGALFTEPMIRWSTVSSPLDFGAYYARQKEEILRLFRPKAEEIVRTLAALSEAARIKSVASDAVRTILEEVPEVPDIGDKEAIASFISVYERINSVKMPGNVAKEELVLLKELLCQLRYSICPDFSAIANWVLNEAFLKETLDLLAGFQDLYLRKKRTAGVLTFADVSRMAVDALTADPELRAALKRKAAALMIDEFQDDNSLQRDLLYLLAEHPERRHPSVPSVRELCPDKLFFVGDEKQSIYRFRGADVSVFRKLSLELAPSGGAKAPELATNYRTERTLLEAFNELFPHVFLRGSDGSPGRLYEAEFKPVGISRSTEGLDSRLEVLLVNERNFDENDPAQMSANHTEAAEIAARIRAIRDSGYLVRGKDGVRPCRWEDFAVLFRSGTRQHLYEKYLREEGIPYRTESLRGLFTDAPVNDLYAMLRLAVYPEDRTAYATVLRSPFARLGAEGFAAAMIRRNGGSPGAELPSEVFDGETERLLSGTDRARFALARDCFNRIRSMADRVSACEIVTHLWYREGYRYAVLSEPGLERYEELYDYFFELARQSDERGETLAAFLDGIARLMETGEKIDGVDVPVEQTSGVQMMTVHKSKGLEFPIVFVVDAGSAGPQGRNSRPVYWSEKTGISVNTGGAEEADEAKENWFFRRDKEEDIRRTEAELKRLLYVAMTRAETRLVVSGTIKLVNPAGGAPRSGQALAAELAEWQEEKEKKADEKTRKGKVAAKQSFFELLLPAFCTAGRTSAIPGCYIEEILPRGTGSLRLGSSRLAADVPLESHGPLYESTVLAEIRPPERTRYSATGLRMLAQAEPESISIAAERAAGEDPLDKLLRSLDMSANTFGTIAHKQIEARFTGVQAPIQAELATVTGKMADLFFASELGREARSAEWKKSEYGFITRFPFRGRMLTVTGQMDLVYEYKDRVVVVDYKTDRDENPEAHAEQLAAYRKAAAELRPGKKAETWLFYLRTGRAVLVE
ncbi:MAG: ATP-dependent helicase/nuclease subunit A [Spirochaetes bacterium ADurb.Bin269]|jgi:ATP-dependent helicase/nuclease subunit A|nr:MAG: ATP-dependent helicase/nuclease subunit A [Spirochaetes bacterium ADurb.Bin269]